MGKLDADPKNRQDTFKIPGQKKKKKRWTWKKREREKIRGERN